ncbi:hypothetical protein HRI_003403000 [Hibiscus trionum]|uniref:arogenate dehydratase n=1 Tax=Hibiscus trionum TaxID=183268 RepID=A0A9W7MBA2_HIBTR|nr:hypothetical protein HRI_003403000 [Hibiscus trionum]
MALFSGGYFFAYSNDRRRTTSFKIPHSLSYSKRSRSLYLSFAFHRKAGTRYITMSDKSKNCGAVGAEMKAGERDQPQLHRQLQTDLARETVEEHQLLHSTPLPSSSTAFSDSRASYESGLRVAYQGIRGANGELAAEEAYPNCEKIACRHFHATFEAVESRVADRAIIPIENSLGGSIHGNYDLLLRHDLHIVGELLLAVSHCLLADHGVKLQDLNTVLSHPQALAQCEKTLRKLGLVGEAVSNTAVAAKQVTVQKLRDKGALASSSAAQIYGLNILAPNMQDDCNNVTRFLVLAREPLAPSTDGPFKTSIVFSLKDGPAVLSDALSVFNSNQIELLKIESRPLKNQPMQASKKNNKTIGCFNYLFYVDVEASMADPRAQIALTHLQELSTFLRVLGCYPMDASRVYD